MKPRDPKLPPTPDLPEEPDDIEIIEVVGMDEEPRALAEVVEEDPEVEFTFDEDPGAGIPAARPAASPSAGAEERLLRLRADFENFKKRVEREREEFYRHATASLVARLLPVLDNFERAMDSAKRTGNGDSVLQGVTLIHRQLLEELTREGLRPVEALGRPFDPALHEAVATEGSSRLPANTVVEEMQRGYFFEDRLLRPALVKVSVDDPDPADGGGVT